MNRMLKIALGAVLASIALPGFAQDPFPDNSENHWAYEAVEGLHKAGCLVGYPDGMFHGNRPMSRYEFAAAAYACYKKMMGMHQELSDQIAELKKMMGGDGVDLNPIKKRLDDLEASVNMMKGWGGRLDAVERMVKEFEPELKSLGADVKQMRQDLGSLGDRVTELEKHKPAVDVHGVFDLVMLAGHSTDGNIGMTPDNRLVGVGEGSYFGQPSGMTRDFQVYHALQLDLTGTNTEGPKWQVSLVHDNMLGGGFGNTAFGNMSTQSMGSGFGTGSSDVYINTASVTFDSALAGQGFNAKLGRVGAQVGPYLLKRSNYTGYYKNERWDNGDYYFDGGILGFNFGKASLHVLGGTNNSPMTSNGVAINPIPWGAGQIDRTLGVTLDFPVGEMGSINLAYLWFDSDTRMADVNPFDAGNQPANRMNVFGGQADLKFDKFSLWGAYSQSTLSENTSNALDTKNKAWDIRGAYTADTWGAGLGYREVEQFFSAPGSWGRLGNQWSPRNIKGFNAKLWFQPSKATKLWAKGEFDEPKETGAGYNYANYDKINSFTIGLDYQLAENWGAMFSYEDTRFDGQGATPDDKMRWYTVGFNYGLGANTSLMFTYQFSDVDFGVGSGNDPLGPSPVGGRKYRGGLFGTQLSLKF
ncbi:MAG: S-layer homology domain-containing protein [Armatimonadetes bacterium]|nr:S-layer homology domain-containing protein [Armatimonadota bacterium]